MRLLLAGSVALVVASCAPVTRATKAEGDAVVFTKRPPAVGEQIVSAFHMDVRAKMQLLHQGSVLHEGTKRFGNTTRYVLTELPRPKPSTRVQRLRYLESTTTSMQDGKPLVAPPSPVTGKSYLITTTGRGMQVTDPNGKAVSKAESDTVKDDLGDVSLGDAFADWLVSQRLRPGEAVKAPKALIPKMFSLGTSAPADVASPLITLKTVRNEPTRRVAVLGVSIEIVGTNRKAVQVHIPMRGTLEVELGTCRLAGVHATGPVQMTGSLKRNGDVFEVHTTGTFSIDATTTPQPAG